jgi:NADPH:quinone reductase-like Zn-dependent oxidoreductase
VLVNGASGGVGHFAVQIAKSFGAEVTSVTSAKNADFVRSLGADDTIDYRVADFTRSGRSWDLIIDTVGNKSLGELRRALSANGAASVIGFASMRRVMAISLLGGKRVAMIMAKATMPDLETLTKLAEAGSLKPTIEKTYPFAELAAAIATLEEGHVAGKLVVAVG